MIDLSQDIHSLSAFKRKTADFMARMKKRGHPVVLTVNGRAALVVQDTASYQRLLELAERAEMMEFLRESRQDIEAGRTRACPGSPGASGQKAQAQGQKQVILMARSVLISRACLQALGIGAHPPADRRVIRPGPMTPQAALGIELST